MLGIEPSAFNDLGVESIVSEGAEWNIGAAVNDEVTCESTEDWAVDPLEDANWNVRAALDGEVVSGNTEAGPLNISAVDLNGEDTSRPLPVKGDLGELDWKMLAAEADDVVGAADGKKLNVFGVDVVVEPDVDE